MKAMIFAAGVGTRLFPLTKDLPKALVKIGGKPMLEWQILKLIKLGIDEIIINIHHFPEQIIDFIKANNSFGITVHFSDESDKLLDTGGGLKKASWFLMDNGPHILQNVDVFTTMDYNEMINFHNKNNALATLAVKNRNTSRYLLFDKNSKLCGWKNDKTNEKIIIKESSNLKALAFSGIHLIESSIFDLIIEEGVFSIIDLYLRLLKDHKISGFIHNESEWLDLGKQSSIEEFERNNYMF